MPERLFLFVQMEFPWELGPADGRYLMRAGADEQPERVVILETVGATPRRGRLGARRRPPVEPEPEPATVPSTRTTVIDPVSVSAERQARAWLTQLDAEREAHAAAVTLNRLLFAHRIATADPHVRELSPAQALTARAGWGEGEQVAYGQWSHARELRFSEHRTRRSASLRPQERFAALLGAREAPLLCEEHTLRARLDLDQGRVAHATLELEHAYTAALRELPAEARPDLEARIAELEQLHPGVIAAARTMLGPTSDPSTPAESDAQALRHALTRLEAALRARTAGGLGQV